jgi:hypothetical protein
MPTQKPHPQAQKILAKCKEAKALDFHTEGARLLQLLTDIERLAENDSTRVSNW